MHGSLGRLIRSSQHRESLQNAILVSAMEKKRVLVPRPRPLHRNTELVLFFSGSKKLQSADFKFDQVRVESADERYESRLRWRRYAMMHELGYASMVRVRQALTTYDNFLLHDVLFLPYPRSHGRSMQEGQTLLQYRSLSSTTASRILHACSFKVYKLVDSSLQAAKRG